MLWAAEDPFSAERRSALIRSYELFLQRKHRFERLAPLDISAPESYSEDLKQEERRYRKSRPLKLLGNIFSVANIGTVIGSIIAANVVKYATDAKFGEEVNALLSGIFNGFFG